MSLPLTTFKLYGPTLICSRTSDGKLRLEGVASSTVRDLHGDQITLKALQKMAKSAIGMTVFRNHEYRVPQDVFGKVTKAKAVSSGAHDKHGEEIWDLRLGIDVADEVPDTLQTYNLLERNEIRLGISVGAMVPDGGAKFDKQKAAYVVDDLDLVEASIVSLPANPRSFVDYVVKAFSGHFPNRLTDQRRAEILASLDEDALTETPEEEGLEVPEGAVAELSSDGTTTTARIVAEAGSPEAAEFLAAHDEEIELAALDDEDPDPELAEEEIAARADFEFGHEHFEIAASIEPDLVAEAWSSAYKTSLPDSAFACPKQRKYPHHTKSGAVDRAHLANALSRVNQGGTETCGKAHLESHAKSMGMGDRSKDADESEFVTALDGPDAVKTTISVWEDPEGGRTIEVNTGRKAPASQSAQDDPEPAGGSSKGKGKAKKELGAEEGVVIATETLQSSTALLAALHGQLTAARTEIGTLIAQRDAALEIAKTAMDGTQQLIARIGEMPVGRKTQAVAVQKDFSDLQAIYADDVRALMTKKGSPRA